ncbi:hypothetical protein PsorP6_005048 [Peronosclerospora sorghi]|uniref:Uncharacterized protein n=1 Tax=Peronosclerospora sorghi TaxID=230839 RepID=A0ACC0W4R1_9STRA|nr:hypothetical protein PsorP6_005048 [Peronosclerospora sorghi]
MPPQEELLPWGRLVLLMHQKSVSLPDHFYLSRSKHCLGRVANRSDIHIPKQFISGLHCIIRLLGRESDGRPIVQIEDESRYGVWVNSVKVGYRKKTMLQNGEKIHFTPPYSKVVTELVYRFEILPSGLNDQNDDLRVRQSVVEMSVKDRTRKRTHEETKGTQSPSKVLLSSPRPRPVKKLRRVTNKPLLALRTDDPLAEPVCSPSPHLAQGGNTHVPKVTAVGEKKRLPNASERGSHLIPVEVVCNEFCAFRNSFIKMKEVEDMLKAQAEELAKVKAASAADLEHLKAELQEVKTQAAMELQQAKAEAAIKFEQAKAEAAVELARTDKLATVKLGKIRAQSTADMDAFKKGINALRDERNTLQKTVDDILHDPGMPEHVRTELQNLKRVIGAHGDVVACLTHWSRSQSPLSFQKQVMEIEWERLKSSYKILLGSGQSQDLIDNERKQTAFCSSLKRSVLSNENPGPSPGDIPQTLDAIAEKINGGEILHG